MTNTAQASALAYIASLNRVRAAAGALFFDDAGRVLLVHPTYKKDWEIPGGCVEPNESPLVTCQREVREELGLTAAVGAMLCVDWTPPAPPWDGALTFVFDGGRLTEEAIAGICLDTNELDRFQFVATDEIGGILIPRLARRVTAALRAREVGASVYLENGGLHCEQERFAQAAVRSGYAERDGHHGVSLSPVVG